MTEQITDTAADCCQAYFCFISPFIGADVYAGIAYCGESLSFRGEPHQRARQYPAAAARFFIHFFYPDHSHIYASHHGLYLLF